MRAVPDDSKFVIADQNSYTADLICPNPRGLVSFGCQRRHDAGRAGRGLPALRFHSAVCTHIMVAYSSDGGSSWHGHRSISQRNVWEHQNVWIAPQLSRLRDGRLVIICDMGHRTSGDDWPRLAFWQRPPRGMANFLFWSDDHGHTWGEPVQCDDVGGEPGYIVELFDGTLVYTRSEPTETDVFESPPPPGYNLYYRNTAVFSDDGGKSWDRTATVSDDPYHGDSEVGIVELEPGHPSGLSPESDSVTVALASPAASFTAMTTAEHGRMPKLAPFNGQRTAVHKLRSGKLLVTYRNRWGTFASYAFIWDPAEELGFEPASFIWTSLAVFLTKVTLL